MAGGVVVGVVSALRRTRRIELFFEGVGRLGVGKF